MAQIGASFWHHQELAVLGRKNQETVMTEVGANPKVFNPATLPDPTPNGYSTAVIVEAGRLAFVSG
jgi:hypothetical protein